MLSMVFNNSAKGDSFSNNIPMVVFTVLFLAAITIGVLWYIIGTYRAEKNPLSATLNNNKRDMGYKRP